MGDDLPVRKVNAFVPVRDERVRFSVFEVNSRSRELRKNGVKLRAQWHNAIVLPVELRKNVELTRTNLVSRMFETWGEIPVALLQQLDLRRRLCGYIGLEDYTLCPLIRPGSFVEIDEHQDKVKTGNWQNEFYRPIYFVELRDGYACSWCELDGNQLVLVPCPQSRGQVRHLRYPTDADIVARVTAVTMRIAEVEKSQPKE